MTTIVMTGGTSGLGRLAASHMLAAPGTRLLHGARRPGPPAAEPLPLDLAHLDQLDTCFDDPHAIASAGLLLAATLAKRLGSSRPPIR
jgi:NAD(P)-dependent dehydrogenase (short-subunit alcohol dehydrogenase family)